MSKKIIKRIKQKPRTSANDYINRSYSDKSPEPKDEVKYYVRKYNAKKDAYEIKLKKYSVSKLWENEAELIMNENFTRKEII